MRVLPAELHLEIEKFLKNKHETYIMSQLAHYGNVYKTKQSLIRTYDFNKVPIKDRYYCNINNDTYYYEYAHSELYNGGQFLTNKKLKIKYICTSLKLLKWYVDYFKFNKLTYYKTIRNNKLLLKILRETNFEFSKSSDYALLNYEGEKWIQKNNYSSK